MTKNHIVSVTFKSKTAHATAFENIMQSVKQDLPTVEGCNAVRVMRHKEDASTYTLIEDWAQQELHSAHIDKLIASGAWSDIEAMLVEAPASVVLSDI